MRKRIFFMHDGKRAAMLRRAMPAAGSTHACERDEKTEGGKRARKEGRQES